MTDLAIIHSVRRQITDLWIDTLNMETLSYTDASVIRAKLDKIDETVNQVIAIDYLDHNPLADYPY